MKPTTFEDLAEQIMFGIIRTRTELEYRIDGVWEYRKGMGFEDVKHALRKGMKMGQGKVEREVELVALYLKDVFKKVRKGVVHETEGRVGIQ